MKLIIALMLFVSFSSFAQNCVVVKGGTETAFDGKSIDGLKIEKKSLNSLNTAFPTLSVQEKVFSGSVQTCSSCEDNFVKCK